MSDKEKLCGCGRVLRDGETVCPSCARVQHSFWMQAGSAIVGVLTIIAPIALTVLSGGKFKPKA